MIDRNKFINDIDAILADAHNDEVDVHFNMDNLASKYGYSRLWFRANFVRDLTKAGYKVTTNSKYITIHHDNF